MKLNHTIALAALVVSGLFAGSIVLRAQETTTNTTPPGGMRARPDFDTLAKQLELTDDQKPKAKVVLDEMQQKQRDLRTDTSVAATDKRAKAKEIRDAATAKLKDILTADQFAKWEKMGLGGPRQRPQGVQPAGGETTTPPKTPKN